MADKLKIVNNAITYIECHLTEKLNLDAIAQAVHYSKYYVHRTFTAITGMTLHQYLQRRQLTEAAKLLVFSSQPIADIAQLSGYDNQQAFSAVFRSLYKLTPHQFREREEFYPLQLAYKFSPVQQNQSNTSENSRTIRFATSDDITYWMTLVRLAVDGFPHLQEPEHIATLKQYIKNRGAFLMIENNQAIGNMLLCYETGSIDFMAVHPLCRNQGVNKQLLDHALTQLLHKKEIRITTFREGDKADTGYRKALKSLGFAEGNLLTEFGYPTQEMILSKEQTNHDAP